MPFCTKQVNIYRIIEGKERTETGMKRADFKKIEHIEESFFSIDESKKQMELTLAYESPDEIFQHTYKAKLPVLSDEFIEAIERPFDYVSSKYKIDLTVRFADMGGYTAEELDQILRMNLDLRIKGLLNDSRAQTKLANSLIVIGILSFLIMILISNHWTTESIWKDIFFYIADISTTVAFWEALTMLVVEKEEKRTHLRNLKNRFVSIRLIQDDAEQEQEQSL